MADELDYDNPWIFNDKIFKSSDIQDNYGFIYKITNLMDGRAYIGRKYFWSKRRLKKKDKKRTTLESNWKEYYGSSDILLEDIEKLGKETFKREILSLRSTKGQVNYEEIKIQFQLDVLYALDSNGNYMWYNNNISGRWFRPKKKS